MMSTSLKGQAVHDSQKCPIVGPNRPCIKMRPSSIALGLRMPEYERRLVISAAKVAGVASINEIIINDSDELTMRPITD